jgi:hypothetical protein
MIGRWFRRFRFKVEAREQIRELIRGAERVAV